jgi:ElaB/YqjD/DUF883 family membrane-anchored ribosome-binding protein
MDRRPDQEVEPAPEEIRSEMAETRAALTNKLEKLEGRVTETFEDVQHRVEATVDLAKDTVQDTVEKVRSTVEKAKDTVQDTVEKVKATFDLRQQVNDHPWTMVGGAVAVGFLIGRQLGGNGHDAVRQFRSHPDLESDGSAAIGRDGPRRVESLVGIPSSAVKEHASRFMDLASSQLHRQLDSLEHAAVAAAGNFVERLITQAVPGLGPFLR